ncbi:MAG: FdhF/YdeP family oxidoreductase [Pyrinomonadaceae bacterium]|nr:FdhF/YdeP family oxidoreductase [Pyrinomonadaceae bacterium]
MLNAENAELRNSHDAKVQNGNVQTVVKVNAETPEGFTGLRVEKNHHTAAGLPAVISTMQHGFSEMGVIRTLRTFTTMNQKGGFDCQSCAWPDPDGDRHIAEFCENGAKAVAAEGTLKRVTPEFFKEHSVAELSQKSDFWLDRQGRITHPMFLKDGATHYEPISWENAFDIISSELNKLESPNDALFYTSGRASNESAYLYQLFVRQFGTNNLPDCSNMCHESSGTALTETIGIGKGTVKLEDFEKCDLILILGQNPGTNHPRMLTTLEHAKRKGAKIVAINPLPEAGLMNVVNPNPQEYPNPLMFPVRMLSHKGIKLSDLFLQVKINGDMALLKGMMKVLLEEEAKRPTKVLDQDFIAKETTGFAEFQNALDEVLWSDIIEQSGLSEAQIREVARLYMNSERVITCWAMGLTQQKNAVGTIQEIVNLHLLRGQLGKEGAGLCPVRGHSNVRGDRTMGIWERPREEFLKKLDAEFNFTAPREHGFDTVEAIKAMYVGKCKTFFALGGNFLSATPDTDYTAKALRRTDLTVQAITKLNRTALITGKQSLILPVLGRSEIDMQREGAQIVSCENSMGVVQMSKGILKPASEHLRSETWVVAQLAKATLGAKSSVDWDAMAGNYDLIRDKIERTIPGFDDFNHRVREAGGFYLPNKPREGQYPTATKKANFTIHELPIHKQKNGELVMMTIRTHDQFNTTIYGLNDRYRGIHGERRVIMMNPSDIAERGFKAGKVVDLTSHFEDGTRHAKHFIVVPFDIPKGNCATYFPETNVLVPIGHSADRSNTPVSKFIIITVAAHVGKNGKPEFAGKFDYDYSANSQPYQISTNGHAPAKKSNGVKALSLLGKLDFQNIVKATIIVAVAGSAVNALLSSNEKSGK